jgi:hypothetical protein
VREKKSELRKIKAGVHLDRDVSLSLERNIMYNFGAGGEGQGHIFFSHKYRLPASSNVKTTENEPR